MNTTTQTPAATSSFAKQVRSLLGQIVLFLILALIFSVLPLAAALLLDKSSLPLAIFTAWYVLWPPLILFLLAVWLYRKETSWLRVLGRAWLGVSLWYMVQFTAAALAGVHLIFQLLSLPATLAGESGSFLVGALLFFIGGAILWAMGGRVANSQVRPTATKVALVLLLLVALVAVPVLVVVAVNPAAAASPAAAIPIQGEIMGWISDVYNLGERRPGSVADQKAIAYLEGKLKEFGLADVRVERSRFDYWEPVNWELAVQPSTGPTWMTWGFYVPYTGPTKPEGLTAEVVDLGSITAPKWQDVAGKIVLVDIPATDISWDQMQIFTYMAFGPQGADDGWHHPYPIGWGMKWVSFYQQIESRHPAGIIGILRDYPDMGGPFTYYCPYDGELRPIPSLYLRSPEGDKLKADIVAGKTTVKLTLDAKVSPQGGESANVYAVLPGKSASTILIHSHHDAPWRSGVEDSSGMGVVLALARYYAQVPQTERERTLVFLFTGGHLVGGATNEDFIAKHQGDILDKTLFDIAIEHIADDYNPPDAPTGKVEPRGVFLTENPVMVSLYASAVFQDNIVRTLVFPTGTPLGVPTDAGQYQESGVPVVSLISGPTWLFDSRDTLERVARWDLVPLTRMYVDFIGRLNATPDWLLGFRLGPVVLALLALVLSPLAAVAVARR